jgi:mono/diheme cytochrome c family protein
MNGRRPRGPRRDDDASAAPPRFRALGLAALFTAVCASAAVPPGEARSDDDLQRGRYLVTTILACGNCHTPKDELGRPRAHMELAGGGLSFDTPHFAGTAPNLTPDRETGIGEWSAEDIKRAITAGLRPDHGRLPGVPLAAIMWVNFYKALTPRDLDAVVAYLRSLPPVRREAALPDYKSAPARETYPDAERGFDESQFSDPVKRGAYLVTIGHCLECHTPMVDGRTDYAESLGRGGKKFGPALVKGLPETWRGSISPNITPHPVSGIGDWTDDEIKRAIAHGVSRDGTRLGPPMGFAWYAGLTDPDLDAIVAYLRTLPPRP